MQHSNVSRPALLVSLAYCFHPRTATAAAGVLPPAAQVPDVFGVPVEFVLFAGVLLGVALLHRHTLAVALTGVVVLVTYKLVFTGFDTGSGVAGLALHLAHEWVMLANLLGLLLGFALLAKHFEESRIPAVLPKFLPDDWKGGFVLLAMIFVLSSFLDNIAAAIIGGTVALSVFRRKVHIAYLSAIVAASNAGGAGSVIGDTTTTMMWIGGVSARSVLDAYVAGGLALVVFGVPASICQQRYSPIVKDEIQGARVDWMCVGVVVFILGVAVGTNVFVNLRLKHLSDAFPFIGAAVLIAVLVTARVRKPEWRLLPPALLGSIFLLSLIVCASLMPVERLPSASWQTTFALGFVSAIFDNIPLTALALEQGGYDWGMLAYAVGFGGSMVWFGSSAGVALSGMFPEAKSVVKWVRHGWYVALAYVVGFMFMLALLGWHPTERIRAAPAIGAAGAAINLNRAADAAKAVLYAGI